MFSRLAQSDTRDVRPGPARRASRRPVASGLCYWPDLNRTSVGIEAFEVLLLQEHPGLIQSVLDRFFRLKHGTVQPYRDANRDRIAVPLRNCRYHSRHLRVRGSFQWITNFDADHNTKRQFAEHHFIRAPISTTTIGRFSRAARLTTTPVSPRALSRSTNLPGTHAMSTPRSFAMKTPITTVSATTNGSTIWQMPTSMSPR